jgi:hypothetical protein
MRTDIGNDTLHMLYWLSVSDDVPSAPFATCIHAKLHSTNMMDEFSLNFQTSYVQKQQMYASSLSKVIYCRAVTPFIPVGNDAIPKIESHNPKANFNSVRSGLHC